MANDTADHAIKYFRKMFLERGPPEKILCDYGPCFKRVKIESFLTQWGVSMVFCCMYKHAGNGMVERKHRAIKQMVAR